MSTTSVRPKPWADTPWPILLSPQAEGHTIDSHYAVYMATQMCLVHNVFIRAMNSIYLQSPYVTNPTDIADLLFYTKTVVVCLDAHHDGEESYLFPYLAEYTKNPNIMAANKAQHAAFHGGIAKLGQYCKTTSPTEYTHSAFQSIIDSFATPLFKHLKDEIPTLLALTEYPSEDLKAIWLKAEKHIADSLNGFDELLPLAFGCTDIGFEKGSHVYPPVPGFVKYIVKYWFARKHRGAWRFNPCDMLGNPRPLVFLPKGDLTTLCN